jgi:hypothetical protein
VVTEQPRDIMNDPVKRKAELKRLHDLGIKGIKVDFFQSDKQPIIQEYFDILTDAAKEQIVVDFHGCTLPRGWERTYPNLLSMEAVRGAENYGWGKDFALNAPVQNNIFAYTRNVVGSMDYTPVTFTDYECCPHITTNAHELALTVLFETGVLHFADRVSAYQAMETLCAPYRLFGTIQNLFKGNRGRKRCWHDAAATLGTLPALSATARNAHLTSGFRF